MPAVLFIASNLLALGVCAQLAELLCRGPEPWRRLLTALALFPLLVLLVILTLGSVGLLTPGAAVMVVAAVFLLLTLFRRGRVARPFPCLAGPWWGSTPPGPLWPLPFALVAASWFYLAASTCLKGTRLGMDDLSYHASGPAQWLLDARISLAPFNYHLYYPFNSETLSLWFMLPWHSDVYASLSGLYWTTLAPVALIYLGLALGRSRSAATLPAAIALVPPVVVHQVTGTFCAVDFAAPVALLAGLALLAPRPETAPLPSLRQILLGGLMVGYAAGAKASMLALTAVPFLWLLLHAARRPAALPATPAPAPVPAPPRWALPLLFALAVFAAGGFWYTRNWLLTGNPIFPVDLGPFDGPMDSGARRYLSLMYWIADPAADWSRWWFIISSHLLWPLLPGLAALTGWLAGAWAWWRPPADRSPAGRALLHLLFATGLLFLLLYPFTPCTGTWGGPTQGAELGIRLRYAVLPFLLGVLMLPELAGSPAGRAFSFALGLAAVAHGWAVGSPWVWLAAIALLAVLGGMRLLRVPPRLPLAFDHPASAWLLVALVLVGLSLWQPRKHLATAQLLRSLGTPTLPVGRAWDAVDHLPPGARIAWFGGESWRYYPLYGRRLQHRPVPVVDNGAPWRPLHTWWHQLEGDWWCYPGNQTFGQMGLPADTSGLVDNLLAQGVQYVFVTSWERGELPPQHFILQRSPHAQAVYHDGCSTIWRLLP